MSSSVADKSLPLRREHQVKDVVVMLAVLFGGALGKALARFAGDVIPPSWSPFIDLLIFIVAIVLVVRVFTMQPVRAVALLTWKAALRFRLFLVIAVLLLASV